YSCPDQPSPIPAAIERRYVGVGNRSQPLGRDRSAHLLGHRRAILAGGCGGAGGRMGRQLSSLGFGGFGRGGAVAVCCLVLAHCSGPFSSKEYSPPVLEGGQPGPHGRRA